MTHTSRTFSSWYSFRVKPYLTYLLALYHYRNEYKWNSAITSHTVRIVSTTSNIFREISNHKAWVILEGNFLRCNQTNADIQWRLFLVNKHEIKPPWLLINYISKYIHESLPFRFPFSFLSPFSFQMVILRNISTSSSFVSPFINCVLRIRCPQTIASWFTFATGTTGLTFIL